MFKYNYTKEEIENLIDNLRNIYSVVRLVNPKIAKVVSNGRDHALTCFKYWDRNERCKNCISLRTVAEKKTTTKFEFFNDDIYFVTSVFIEVNGVPQALELVMKLNDETLVDVSGQTKLLDKIYKHNDKIYKDALTGAYNRVYFNDNCKNINDATCVAFIDLDNFKTINDTYGHLLGDSVLISVTRTIMNNLKDEDKLIRMGGDEFIIIFKTKDKEYINSTLDKIKGDVSNLQISFEKINVKTTISIGASFAHKEILKMVEEADEELYQSKRNKNSISIIK